MIAKTQLLAPFHPGKGLSGSFRDIVAGPSTFYEHVAWQHNGIARVRAFHRVVHIVAHPDYVHQILVSKQRQYRKSDIYQNLEQMIGRGLVTLEGDLWRKDRKIIQPGFHPKVIAHMVDIAHSSCDSIFAQWSRNAEAFQPVVPALREISLRIISETLLNTSLDAMKSSRFSENLMEASALLTRKNWSLLQLPERWPTPINRRLRSIRMEVIRFFDEQVNRRLSEGVGKRGDMLDLLLSVMDQEEEPTITRQRVLTEILTLFSAGYDTTSSAIAWTIHYLSQFPDYQLRLQEEVDRVLGQRLPTWQDLDALVETERVFHEALRLNPPIHSILRTATADDQLGPYFIPAGSQLMVSLSGANHSPLHWEHALEFDPDRFTTEVGKRAKERAFVPFSAGARRCIGAQFATVEAKLLLARIAQRFTLTPDPQSTIRISAAASQYPEGLRVRFTARTSR
ncbi:MAG: cytochrome P450 [Puniceicoccaceae bacterium]